MKPTEKLFWSLYNAKDEEELMAVIDSHSQVFANSQWKPLGGNQSNFGIVKNQQSNPIAALIEKITNSIDALLMKRCYEMGVDPKGADAPQTMDKAIARFFVESKNWDLPGLRNKQARDIQVIADGKGPRTAYSSLPTSVIVYDNGEGQNPDRFEDTFLSGKRE